MMAEPGHETRFAELKRYVGFTAADAGLLRGFRGAAEPHFERIAQEFYDRIRRHEEAHAVFTGEAQIARLQRSLVRWLERVFSGTYDEAYFAETTAIGRVHVKVGLPQRYMFTAMALIRSSLMQLAGADGAHDMPVCGAICRLLDLELAIMLESYSDDWISRIQHVGRGAPGQALDARRAARAHLDGEAVAAQQVGEHLPRTRVVLDDEDRHGHGRISALLGRDRGHGEDWSKVRTSVLRAAIRVSWRRASLP